MLEPGIRSLYTQALTPPPGMALDAGLATTYSLDLTTLLTIPVSLAFGSGSDVEEILKDGLSVHEAVKRTANKLVVFCQKGQIHVPSSTHPLFSLLEKVVVEAKADGGGVFHPKIWVFRFCSRKNPNQTHMRLMVLSRNLTFDRSWDLSLVLEGEPAKREIPANRPLAQLIRKLPKLAAAGIPVRHRKIAEDLAEAVLRTKWIPPANFDEVRFHTTGLESKSWKPPNSDRMVVISPFLTDKALIHLAKSTTKQVGLLSRPEALESLNEASRGLFSEYWIINDEAEIEDGEDTTGTPNCLNGLHAKAYLCEVGDNMHIFMGSANATTPALLKGRNVEILAELIGSRRSTGGINTLFHDDGLKKLLDDHYFGEDAIEVDQDAKQAERDLEKARQSLIDAKIKLLVSGEGDRWEPRLIIEGISKLEGVETLKVWLVTKNEGSAVSLSLTKTKLSVDLAESTLASLTGFVAFHLVANRKLAQTRFVLNVPVEGLPAERDAAVTTSIVRGGDKFLRYILLLLSEMEDINLDSGLIARLSKSRSGRGGSAGASLDELPLLEELTRAFCRDPERITSIERLLSDLEKTDEGRDTIPTRFKQVWQAFKDSS